MGNSLFKNIGTVAVLSAAALLLSGCPDHYHHYYEPVVPNTLVLENHASSYGDILYAYVSPSTSGIWGSDRLGWNVLNPGDQLVLDVYDCNRRYDIMVEYDSGLRLVEPDQWLPCNTTTIVSFVDY